MKSLFYRLVVGSITLVKIINSILNASVILERNENLLARNETHLAGNENCLARNKMRGGNLHLSGTVYLNYFNFVF